MGEIMPANIRPSLYTIPVHRAFADALAAGLVRQHGGEPLGLARGMVLLPNNRAVTAVRDAFVRLAGGALLLPRLVALGEGDLDAAAGAALDLIDRDPVPPVIDPVQRRLLLANVLRTAAPDRATSLSEAIRLADGLASALDALAFEERTVADLYALKDTDPGLAQHWDVALDLVTKVSAVWPGILASLGLADRADVRNLLLDRTAKAWRTHGLPTRWMVAAGITTSAPAVARLLKSIANADGGSVVFPHLDLAMPDAVWAMLGPDPASAQDGDPPPLEIHAQFHLKLLLNRMDAGRDDVLVWPDSSAYDGPESRDAFISAMLAPASATGDWPGRPIAQRQLPGVNSLVCANPAEEALAIALALREVLETPEKTAALVTPDRAIAQRVIGNLARWGISIDDSAGTPLPQTPPGALLLALVRAAGARFAPVELLALLSHPLVHSEGEARRAWLDQVRRLDLALRGPRPPQGLGGVTSLLNAKIGQLRGDKSRDQSRALADMESLAEWWAGVACDLALLEGTEPLSLANAMARVRNVMATLAGDAPWSGADGRAMSERFAKIAEHANSLPEPMTGSELAGVLQTLLADVAVRPPQGGHPRLFIWGLIEARLQRADRMILAGLNEGQWPQPPAPDPWLAPGIRRRLGLPGLERQIGLASHDFASALGASEVILTRSKRDGSSPTIPSRLILRIDAFAGDKRPGPGALNLAAMADAVDAATAEPQGIRPAPAPPRDLRKAAISASQLDTLLADPFAWYAQAILGLRRLDALDDQPTPMWRGTLVHDLLEKWLKAGGQDVGDLIARAEARIAEPDIGTLLRTIWAPRLLAALRWTGEEIVTNRAARRVPLLAGVEERGEVVIDGIRLSGKADRIDRLPDGSLAIVDYKTGGSVNKKALANGYVLQLGLLGAIAERGGFEDVAGTVAAFEYWRLNRHPKSGEFGWVEEPFYKNAEDGVQADGFVAFAVQRLGVAAKWLAGVEPFEAKLRPEYAPYADYDQLMRLEEWYGVLGSPEDAA